MRTKAVASSIGLNLPSLGGLRAYESGGGPPHSKTLRAHRGRRGARQRLGVRPPIPSGAHFHRTCTRVSSLRPSHATRRILSHAPPGTKRDFSVAPPAVWSDAGKNGERTSPRSRHPVAGHGGILAPLPGLDRRPPKPKWVNHFSKNLVAKLKNAHKDGSCSEL